MSAAAPVPANVPATALSRYPRSAYPTGLVIGTQWTAYPDSNPDDSNYMLVVVDLTNLNVVVNVVTNEVTVPPSVAQYGGNAQYFLFVIGNCLNGYNVPQGALYTFLQQVGAGPELARAEQMIDQLSTGVITAFSYVLATGMAEADVPGFEAFSFTEPVILTMQFMPITVNGQTIYAPIESGA